MTTTQAEQHPIVEASPGRAAAVPHRGHGRLAEVPHITGLVLGVFAVLLFLWSLSPALRYLTQVPRHYVDVYYFDAPDTSLVWAVVVGLLAGAIASRKRVAWWLLVVYLLLYAISNILDFVADDDIDALVAFVVHIVVIGILIAARNEFYTRVRPGALWKALGVLVAGLALGCLIGWGLVELAPGTLPPGPQRPLWAVYRVTAAVLVNNEHFDGHPRPWVNFLLGLFGAIALLAAVVVLLRSRRADNAMTALDESALRGLLAASDVEDSLGYFATRRDKAVVFAPNGKAAITYRVELGVSLASGDPIGPKQAWPQAIRAWLEEADRFGWAPAVMGASELGATAYRNAGLAALRLGDEAILDTRTYSLA
ncbi:phosphatidylglycerol lysyltransferase domain-containing protein, partial [Amycolatopsis sp. NPDC003676]